MRTETIKIAGAANKVITVRVSRHGPVITDNNNFNVMVSLWTTSVAFACTESANYLYSVLPGADVAAMDVYRPNSAGSHH